MCILWSPVLRDMINLYPTPALLESTHGLAYLLQVEEDSRTWAAVLDMMYPVHAQPAIDWVSEHCLNLAATSCCCPCSATLLAPAGFVLRHSGDEKVCSSLVACCVACSD